jgi:hypothetical protein
MIRPVIITTLIWLCSSPHCAVAQPATSERHTDEQPAWRLSPDVFNMAVIVYDYQSLKLKQVYLQRCEKCGGRNFWKYQSELVRAGDSFFSSVTGWWHHREIPEETDETLGPFDAVLRVGSVAVLWKSPSDFGAIAVVHSCSKVVLFAATTTWMGVGEHLYPAVTLPLESIKSLDSAATPPDSLNLNILGFKMRDEETLQKVWSMTSHLNIVHDFGKRRYFAWVYPYLRTEGESDPRTAEWWVVVQTE